jgi:hypothetical protein
MNGTVASAVCWTFVSDFLRWQNQVYFGTKLSELPLNNMKAGIRTFPVLALLALLASGLSATAQGVIVWNGPMMNFASSSTDWTQQTNQDHITADVWLTRAATKGMFNAASEGFYTSGSSPADTEWAIGSLANYASLTYSDWQTCYGGPGQLQGNITSEDAVLHLISDNIYIGIRFTFWGGSAGGFAYERTTPLAVPEPSSISLLAIGVLGSFVIARKQSAPGKA